MVEDVACTVEMADTDEPVEVAVIDEFQMVGDPERGWAWTRAILGVPAEEGDGSAVDLITRMCSERLGDIVEVKRYERLSPLVAVKGGLHNGIQRGDCIVAFSRQKIHSFKQQIEKHTGFRCCVVYGSLPPEARSTQAALFNDPNSGYDVLVASDAIGMGLNLNIRRVIFSSLSKFDGIEERTLTVSEIKQIAGRAGRFGSIYPEGRVTCLNPRDSETLVNGLQTPIPELQQLGLAPTYEQLEMFYLTDESKPPLSVLLDRFALYASVDNSFFLCDYTNIRELAVLLEPLNLDLKDLYTFCLSPADAKKPLVKHSLYQYASLYASDIRTVPLRIEPGADGPIYHGIPHLLDTFDDREKLKRLEELYLVADNYAWLSFRLQKFDEREKSLVVKTQVHAQISALLDSMSEAQGEATWSRIERMRREVQLQRDAHAMRSMDKESRRDRDRDSQSRKISWNEETVLVNPGRALDTQAPPSPVQMDLARERVLAQALAAPQVQPRALPQPQSYPAAQRQPVRPQHRAPYPAQTQAHQHQAQRYPPKPYGQQAQAQSQSQPQWQAQSQARAQSQPQWQAQSQPRWQAQAHAQSQPQHQAQSYPNTKEAYEKQFFEGKAQQPRAPLAHPAQARAPVTPNAQRPPRNPNAPPAHAHKHTNPKYNNNPQQQNNNNNTNNNNNNSFEKPKYPNFFKKQKHSNVHFKTQNSTKNEQPNSSDTISSDEMKSENKSESKQASQQAEAERM